LWFASSKISIIFIIFRKTREIIFGVASINLQISDPPELSTCGVVFTPEFDANTVDDDVLLMISSEDPPELSTTPDTVDDDDTVDVLLMISSEDPPELSTTPDTVDNDDTVDVLLMSEEFANPPFGLFGLAEGGLFFVEVTVS